MAPPDTPVHSFPSLAGPPSRWAGGGSASQGGTIRRGAVGRWLKTRVGGLLWGGGVNLARAIMERSGARRPPRAAIWL